MSKRDAAQPSEVELQALALMWERGSLTVREVREAMPDGKARAYTTVLAILQGMEKKGLVTHEAEGRLYRYAAAVKRRGVLGPMMRRLVARVFSGDPAALLQQLLDESRVTEDDLAAMKRLLKEREGQAPKGRAKR